MKKIPRAFFCIVFVLLSSCTGFTNHPVVDGKDIGQRLADMNKLVALHYSQGHYEQAESFSLKTLKLRTEHLGEKHPDTLANMGNLAELYRLLGH